MEKHIEEVQEGEFTEIEETVEATQAEHPRTEVRVGMHQNGEIYFFVDGTDQNLIMVDGLLDYAKREMDKVWANKLKREVTE